MADFHHRLLDPVIFHALIAMGQLGLMVQFSHHTLYRPMSAGGKHGPKGPVAQLAGTARSLRSWLLQRYPFPSQLVCPTERSALCESEP